MSITLQIPPRAVPFRVADPELIPARRYYDEGFFELEREYLWPHVWQMACRLEEIPNVGDWIEYKIFDKSVIVVRSRTGIKAFHNSCRHRGVRFANGSGNCERSGFACPFHGWRWNMDGENTFVYARDIFNPDLLDQADIALIPCRVDTWGGCAFINFDDEAPGLRESLGPVTERLDARNVDKLKLDLWVSTELPTNWKLAMEAFMEGYHVMGTHPQIQKLTSPEINRFGTEYGGGTPIADPKNTREWLDITLDTISRLSTGMAGMVDTHELAIAESLRDMELPDDIPSARTAFYTRINREITEQHRARGVPAFDLNEVAATTEFHAVEFLFPNYFLLPAYTAMSGYRIRPLSSETCLFELFSLSLHPDDEVSDAPTAPTPIPYDDPAIPEIPAQDYSNLPIQQLGLHAKGFEYMRLSREMEGLISDYQRLIDGYLAGVDPARLARATGIVCSGYEREIRDIGF